MSQLDHDELESELGAFRPQPISKQLRDRIATSLAPPLAPRRSRARQTLVRAVVVTGGLVAASLAMMIGSSERMERGPNGSVVATATPDASLDQRTPSLWVYRQASLQSPAALEQLLDTHARDQRTSNLPSVRGFSFAPNFHSLSGEF